MPGSAKVLNSRLPKEGSKIIVLPAPKNSHVLPHSVGFISSYDTQAVGRNVIGARVVLLKKGKTGMDRLDRYSITLPIYFYSGIEETMVAVGGRYYIRVNVVEEGHKDLRTITPHDFMGWSLAKVRMLYDLNNRFGVGIKLNTLGDRMSLINKSPEAFRNDRNKAEDVFCAKGERLTTINFLREKEARLTKLTLRYHKDMVHAHLSALSFLEGINDYKDSETGKDAKRIPAAVLNRTKKLVEKEFSAICGLIKSHGMKI